MDEKTMIAEKPATGILKTHERVQNEKVYSCNS
jgi:hypothetical protein